MKLQYLKYNQNWNVGFFDGTPQTLLNNKVIGKVEWMKHNYKDRWFADPFIYDVTDSEIIVFAEECEIINPLGRIVELVIDKETKELKQRYLLLSLDSHLSYPAFIKTSNGTIVYPENGKSGSLRMYDYDPKSHKLINPRVIINEPVADGTIFSTGEGYLAIGTKYPNTQQGTYLYTSTAPDAEYVFNNGFSNNDRSCSRPGGNIFMIGNKYYRPAQDCRARYGAALSIVEMEIERNQLKDEKKLFTLMPNSFRYNLGIHTLNYHDGIGVIDGYGYYYPILGRLLNLGRIIKRKLK